MAARVQDRLSLKGWLPFPSWLARAQVFVSFQLRDQPLLSHLGFAFVLRRVLPRPSLKAPATCSSSQVSLRLVRRSPRHPAAPSALAPQHLAMKLPPHHPPGSIQPPTGPSSSHRPLPHPNTL